MEDVVRMFYEHVFCLSLVFDVESFVEVDHTSSSMSLMYIDRMQSTIRRSRRDND
jgi:hypothetical protein